MGGLAGIVRRDRQAADAVDLEAMTEAAHHRAAGGVSTWYEGAIGLAQLIFTPGIWAEVLEKNGLAIVSHARIDNRDELLTSLKVAASVSDTELILAAYGRWGTDVPAYLIGDFAFAVWDGSKQQLFAARDPMAMNPFFYHLSSQRLAFASEIKQLLVLPGVEKNLNERTIAAYLTGAFGQEDATFYKGVQSLPPAHALLMTSSSNRVWRYWEADLTRRIRFKDERDYQQAFKAQFVRAVKDRLKSPHPVGIALSGGVDSGAVAATAGWLCSAELRAYSWAFEDPQLSADDERATAKLVTEPYGIPLIPIWGDDAWPLGDSEHHGPDRDEPYIWFSQTLNDRLYCKAQKDGVRILLSGNRGDELVGDWIYDYPGWLSTGYLGEVWRDLRRYQRATGQTYTSVLKTALRPLRQPTYVLGPAPWIPDALVRRSELIPFLAARSRGRQTPQQARYGRIFGFAAAHIMTFDERRMAQYGVALSSPWSDRRLAEFVLAIPQWQVQRLSQPKRLVKEALQDMVPRAAMARLAKTTQGNFYDLGLKHKSKATVQKLVRAPIAADYGFLEPRAVQDAYCDYLEGKPTFHDLWRPLTLELWLQRYWNSEF